MDLTDIEIVHSVEWQHGGFEKLPPGSADYKVGSRLVAKGTFKDTITVFTVPGGGIADFREIRIHIRPTKKGAVGGERKATTMDGVAYSDMTSTNVPDEGLMTGDPGTLAYIDPTKDKWPSDEKKPYLILEGYIDEVEFSSLMQRLSVTTAPIRKGMLRMVAELFQNEVEASLFEPYYPQDYGLLLRGEDKTYGITRARSESVSVAYKLALVPPEPDRLDRLVEENKAAEAISIDNLPPQLVAKISKDMLVKIEKRLGLLTGIVGFAAAFVVGNILFG
ncbi:hypothetical protein [Agrobacterium tumefaciens]|uniref:hypothetical protein n=1 Tax=Agrobacterium tumefaciens TaxID=358 RepID=UPI002863C015|nr:hypothetical protein [Agrobacterium tumefaciens]MDR6587407.1 hypothetical protein [Agrobacterium tumefaciens]